MGGMRHFVASAVLVTIGCGAAPAATSADLGGTTDLGQPGDIAHASSPSAPPAGFWNACQSSTDCSGFVDDEPPGFLGCYSYVGVDHCSRPCNPTAPCWMGAACTCATYTNAGGFSQTDCYCSR